MSALLIVGTIGFGVLIGLEDVTAGGSAEVKVELTDELALSA